MTIPYLHVYRAPSGEWPGKVLDEVAGIGGCGCPKDVWGAASEQFPGIMGLSELVVRVETWLREEVVAAYDELKADPSRALTVDQVREAIAAAHRRRLAAEK